ncbi:MAG TPA: hypothetical protein PLG90_10090 [Ignavibacteria bacterium]|nr:hypothetical protein [Ignavibacteria bacterium]
MHWTKNLKLVLEFQFGWIDEKDKDLSELIESTLADKTKPLVGKMVKYEL